MSAAEAFKAWAPDLRAAAANGDPVAAAEIERRTVRRIQKKQTAAADALDRVCPLPTSVQNFEPYVCPDCGPDGACECSL